MKTERVELEVLEFTQVAGRSVAAARILSGEPTTNILLLSETDGTKWKIKGSAFLPAEKWASGIRGLILEGESINSALSKGGRLISE